uniref:Uncharacterized protein n=1 Tax=Trichogramma kaykai TaxID=54128 RepID=A0ABD2WG76_9HYME
MGKGSKIGKLEEGKLKRTKSAPRSRPKKVLHNSTSTSENNKNRQNKILSNNKGTDTTKIETRTDSDIRPDKMPKLKNKPKQNKTKINTNIKIVNSELNERAIQKDADAAHTRDKSTERKLHENDSLSTCDKNILENRKLANQSKSTKSDNTVSQHVNKKSKNKTSKKKKKIALRKQTSATDTLTATVNEDNTTVANDSSHRISVRDYDTNDIELIPAALIRIVDPRFYVKVDILGETFACCLTTELYRHGLVKNPQNY